MCFFFFTFLKVLVHCLSIELKHLKKVVDQKCPPLYAGKKLLNVLIDKKVSRGVAQNLKAHMYIYIFPMHLPN